MPALRVQISQVEELDARIRKVLAGLRGEPWYDSVVDTRATQSAEDLPGARSSRKRPRLKMLANNNLSQTRRIDGVFVNNVKRKFYFAKF